MAIVRCRDYIVTHPDGHKETIRGLPGFCLTWGLTRSGLTRVARGQAHHHKGFKIRYVVEPLPVMPGSAPVSLAYVITHPGGQEEGVTGLAAFCREHGLTAGHMALVARGKRSDHKGYGCRYANPGIAGRHPVERTVRMVLCRVCGKRFETKSNNAKYCPDCRKGAEYRRHRERLAQLKAQPGNEP
jgi:hypothetical protein